MNIPPVIGLVITLSIGIVIGSFATYQYYTKSDLEDQIEVRQDDNEQAKVIEKETVNEKSDETLKVTVKKHVDKPVKECKELSDEEIESMCTSRYMPDDILRDFRYKANRAWRRFN